MDTIVFFTTLLDYHVREMRDMLTKHLYKETMDILQDRTMSKHNKKKVVDYVIDYMEKYHDYFIDIMREHDELNL